MGIDLNHGSGFIYGRIGHAISVSDRVNALIDAALVARNRRQQQRDYLGGSRIGEPCARKLVYEVTHTHLAIFKISRQLFNEGVLCLRKSLGKIWAAIRGDPRDLPRHE